MFFNGLLSFFNKVMFFTSYVGGNSFPKPLSKEEEADCLKRAKAGEEEARETLIRHNLRLVAHIVKKYTNQGEVDDLISIGSIGLIKGINSYEYGRGTALATYIARCVENEILMYLRWAKKLKNNVSMYEPIGHDNEGNKLEIVDLLCSDENSVVEEVGDKIQKEVILKFVQENLQGREYQIICMRYGLDGEYQKTQRETAEILGISRSYISRIEKKALEKLRSKAIKDKLVF